jgi:hypothetical protein
MHLGRVTPDRHIYSLIRAIVKADVVTSKHELVTVGESPRHLTDNAVCGGGMALQNEPVEPRYVELL